MQIEELTDASELDEDEEYDSDETDFEDEIVMALALMRDMLEISELVLKDKKVGWTSKKQKKDFKESCLNMRSYVNEWST